MLYVKQYGLWRTGTNAARTLVERHVADASVLMHVLGDKHGLPVPLREVLAETAGDAAPASSFVFEATARCPAETTDLSDPRQRAHLRAHAAAIHRAVCADELRVLVSIRDPYRWVAAVLRWRRRLAAEPTPASEPTAATVEGLCTVFNTRYRAWLTLAAQCRAGSLVLRQEELAGEASALLARVCDALRLGRAPAHATLRWRLRPAGWDYEQSAARGVRFERAPRPAPLLSLPPEAVDVVTARIDWGLIAPYGYEPCAGGAVGAGVPERQLLR